MSGFDVAVSISHNWPDIARQMQKMQKDIADKATARALNATVTQGQAEMARQISRTYRITQSAVKQRLNVSRARRVGGQLRMEVTLEASRKGKGRSMNLIAFVEQSITLAQARKRMKAGEGGSYSLRNGVVRKKALELRFKIKRDGAAKMLPGAFIGNKGRTVFVRTGKERLPIVALSTIDVVQMFNVKTINAIVRQVMLDRFRANWQREVRVVTGGYA